MKNCGNILVLKYLVFKDFSISVIVIFKFHRVNVIMHPIDGFHSDVINSEKSK